MSASMNPSTRSRAAEIDDFLARSGWGGAAREPLPGDASFRRYVRLVRGGAAQSRAMLMDAPPPMEDVRPFLTVARWLGARGYSAPRILAEDGAKGLLVIEDFGDATFTRELARGSGETALYEAATDVLIALHRRSDAASAPVPAYDDARLLAEAELLVDWFLPAIAGAKVSPAARAAHEDAWRGAFARARFVPETLVLRDYHVDNLMVLPGRKGIAACGLLDFQDAVIGPVAYDLVSLLEDARRDLAPALADAMLARYLAAFPDLDRPAFLASYAVLGAQRAAKIVGIFTRLHRRDAKAGYLAHIPRVWRRLEADLRHPALADVRAWFDIHVPRALRRAPPVEFVAAAPRRAMVLAAGRGERMRPLSDRRPKPLIAVGGRAMLDRALDALAAAGVERAVVNLHHLGAQIETHLAARTRPKIAFSREDVLLDTGGGVARALGLLGPEAFFVVNGDVVWTEGGVPALRRLADSWRPEDMDGLLLVQARARAIGYAGAGDFSLDAAGRLARRGGAHAPFVFTGLQILSPGLFAPDILARAPDGAFSLNAAYDGALAAGRLFGLEHDGAWLHVGTPGDLDVAEIELGRLEGGA